MPWATAQAQDLQLRALTLLQSDERVRQRLGGSISVAPGGLSTRRARRTASLQPLCSIITVHSCFPLLGHTTKKNRLLPGVRGHQ